MKKLLITLLITSLISFLFGNYIFKVYIKNVKEIVKEASSIYDDVYMLLYGSYNTIEKAKKNNLNNYILKEEDGFYKVYIVLSLKSIAILLSLSTAQYIL